VRDKRARDLTKVVRYVRITTVC